MNIIHIGDLHIGKSFHKINIIEDQRHVLSQIIELMRRQKANIVIAGDVYDSANPSLEAQELFLEFAMQIKQLCAEQQTHCWITVGNHDSARRLLLFKDFLAPEINIIEDCLVTTCEGVQFCFLSFVKPSLAEQKYGKVFNTYSEAFNAYLSDLSVEQRQKTVLVAHQSFEGCTTGKSEAMTFFDDAIMLDDVKAFPLVLAAHIHKRQKVGTNVYYCGSLLPYAFGDSYTKDIRMWHIESTEFTYTDYPIDVLHDLQVIRGDLKYCLSQQDIGAFVKIELIDDLNEPDIVMNELKVHFKNLITVTSGIKDTWEADLAKPTAQFTTITEAIDSFCSQIDIPEFTDTQKVIIEELLNEDIDT